MRRLKATFLLIAVAGTLGLAACGGDSNEGGNDNGSSSATVPDRSADEAAIIASVETLNTAVNSADPVAFCENFDPVALKQRFKTVERCADALRPVVVASSKAIKARGGSFEVESISFQGERKAEAVFKNGYGQAQMVKVGDGWYVQVPAGPIGG